MKDEAMIISVANQKGGSGKTTTSAAIVSGATVRGKKALAIDLDSQCNLTFIMDGDPGGVEDLITQHTPRIQHTAQGDLIGGDLNLAIADSLLIADDRIYALKRAIMPYIRVYDVIVIDCGPMLGTLLINALTASDGVVIPVRAKMTNLQGLYQLAQTIRQVKENYNNALEVLGVLFTEYNGRTNAARTMTDTIRETAAGLNIPVFDAAIRQGVAIDEAQILRESIFTYAPHSNQAKDYADFLDEIGI